MRSKTTPAASPVTPAASPLSSPPPAPSDLTPEEQKLLTYENVAKLAAILDDSGWSFEEEMRLLLEIARSAKTDAARLRALADLRKLRQEILKLAGVIGELKATRERLDAEGNVLHESVVASLIRKGGSLDPSNAAIYHNPPGPTPREPQLLNDGRDPAGERQAPAEAPAGPIVAGPAAIPGLASCTPR